VPLDDADDAAVAVAGEFPDEEQASAETDTMTVAKRAGIVLTVGSISCGMVGCQPAVRGSSH